MRCGRDGAARPCCGTWALDRRRQRERLQQVCRAVQPPALRGQQGGIHAAARLHAERGMELGEEAAQC